MRLRARAEGSEWIRLEASLIIAAYALINSLIGFLQIISWPRRRPRSALTVCVYKIGNLGDLVCALPALSAIRKEYPSARLMVLSSAGNSGRPGARAVLSGIGWVDELIEYYPEDLSSLRCFLRFVSMLRRYRFDVFIEFPNDTRGIRDLLRNIVFARLVGPKWAGGWRVNTIRLGLQAQSEQIEFPNEVRRLLSIMEEIGIPASGAEMLLPVNRHGEQQAEELIERANPARGKRLAVLAPGGKRPGSRWPADRFAKVGRSLVDAGYHLFVMGSPSEFELGKQVSDLVGSECTNVTGQTDVTGAAELMRRCDLAICNDSGLQHVASAVGTPCVTIFSATHVRGKWWPNHPKSIVFHKMVPCHTCFLDRCPVGDICVRETTTSEVADAALRLLKT